MPSGVHMTAKRVWLNLCRDVSSGMRVEGSQVLRFLRQEVGSQFIMTCGAYSTIDDRFIAKELSKAELQAMETFAPAYFDYMSSSVHSNVRFCIYCHD